MMKEYIKPEMISIEVVSDEMMNVTSNIDMGGTTDSFDAVMRQSIDDGTEVDIDLENLW